MRVFAIIPRAGLGNRLLVWAKALVFSYLNNTPLYIIGLNKLHIGPLLRNEKSKRFYLSNFRLRVPIKDYLVYIVFNKNKALIEPPISKLQKSNRKTLVIFNGVPHYSDYFAGLKPYRNFIKEELFKIASRKTLDKYFNSEIPYIGIHIRMGDFRKVDKVEDVNKIGLARTPLYYFIDCINKIRSKYKKNIPVTIFSDGYEDELKEILTLDNVKLFNTENDLADLLVLSKSKIIIVSEGSTFSYWAGFLSEASIIRADISQNYKLRSDSKQFEGILQKFLIEELPADEKITN